MIQACGKYIFVVPDPAPTSVRGLALPRSAQRPPATGRVLSAGSRVLARVPDLAPGLRVAFRPYAGRILEVGGQTVRLLEEHEMLAILPGVDEVEASE